ncbi:MFS transporter [Leptotrichia sp. OH3620_COT-345]|uniref:MFS transporter n=1 Tax=Leptotrichia sp. OH3620_COT-345 TaxID=2491048 RepID=UPI001F306C1B|nr:MFS transporter [Leptotrichia sp. OH3620_COT-345]
MIILMFFCIIVYNLAHPATPGLIELRNWKKSISGEFLAVMSTAMFMSSPYLGALADKVGMKKIFIFMPFMYGTSQIFFGFVNFLPIVFIARVIAGFASGGTYAVAFGYVSQLSSKEEKSKNIAKISSAAVIGGAIGQKTGGIVARYDTRYPFGLQFICGCIVSLLIFFILKEIVKTERGNRKEGIREKKNLNPFATFKYINELDSYSKFFCFIIFLSNVGIFAYASALNYFLKFHIKVNSDTIGTFVMCSSLLAFFGTSVLLVKFIAKYKEKVIHKIMILIGIILMSVILYRLNGGTVSYVFMAIYTMTYEIARSLGNSIVAQRYKEEQGKILGVTSAVGFLGSAAGSLMSGYLLSANYYFPFIVNLSVMTMVLLLLTVSRSFFKK